MAAKKSTTTGSKGSAAKASPAKAAVAKKPVTTGTTEVRNTAIPKKVAVPAAAVAPQGTKREVTHEQIALAAYHLWLKRGGSEHENWIEAERQLRGGK